MDAASPHGYRHAPDDSWTTLYRESTAGRRVESLGLILSFPVALIMSAGLLALGPFGIYLIVTANHLSLIALLGVIGAPLLGLAIGLHVRDCLVEWTRAPIVFEGQVEKLAREQYAKTRSGYSYVVYSAGERFAIPPKYWHELKEHDSFRIRITPRFRRVLELQRRA